MTIVSTQLFLSQITCTSYPATTGGDLSFNFIHIIQSKPDSIRPVHNIDFSSVSLHMIVCFHRQLIHKLKLKLKHVFTNKNKCDSKPKICHDT